MASSVFERTRALHADIEEMREQLLDKIVASAPTSKDRILLDHELKTQLDDLTACQAKLLELYEDKDGLRSSELSAMSGPGDALWTTFYETLSSIRMYHAKFPNAGRITHKEDAAAAGDAEETTDANEDGVGGTVGRIHFTAEESFGSRVDMHSLFERYINLPQFSRQTDYLTFLATFHQFASIPRTKKIKAQREEYRKWLTSVRDYLTDFHQRIQPLVDIGVMRQMIADDFEQRWTEKTVPGWFGPEAPETEQPGAAAASAAAAAAAATAATPAATDATTTDAPTPVAAAPAAAVADASNPLYCVACAKLFAKQTVFDAHLTGKKHKKSEEILRALAPKTDAPATTDNQAADAAAAPAAGSSLAKLSADIRALALLEDEIHQFALILQGELESTIHHLQKKQTRTYEEIASEIAAQQAEIAAAKLAAKEGAKDEEEEEDENAPLYNPLNLPLGFDGKPIPYWLYKLHGLNLKSDCEICGNFTYWGPRNFERHFTEWRHAYGMRALGIPNTKHFAHITKMDAALALFEKLKKEGVGAGWRADEEEEYEDSEGNVFNKRTYLELQKQGLL